VLLTAAEADIEVAAARTTAAVLAGSTTTAPSTPLAGATTASAASAAATADTTADLEVYFSYSCRTGLCVLAVWLVLFAGAVALRSGTQQRALQLLGTFYYVGTIIFGGGVSVQYTDNSTIMVLQVPVQWHCYTITCCSNTLLSLWLISVINLPRTACGDTTAL
jgi:uncharacterized membrane protein YiaA